MAARDVLKNLNLWLDGWGQAGQLREFNPPKITLQTEEWKGGGMNTPVDLTMGLQKLVADFSAINIDANLMKTASVAEGATVPLTVRAALESFDGTVTPVVINLFGKITEIDHGTWTPGQASTAKYTMSLTYYKWTQGGQVIHEVDVVNMVTIINGVDQTAEQRNAIGG